ncbi:YdeI/OmpD-associated family protein [Sphingomonas piscis]|uniref:YdeI/OmpD-associated family protein n=1 Tax=Sphingomonas piscis TaxID=2714943 RepID=A0A6G7YSA0_9SPHN|nr:YdeI/OmpD-associated family protein [Sphingomonas piscis]QIK79617.1 YdeI/OmpD-associated family protein [Sphingomonas piscis]
MSDGRTLPGGVVHELPDDLRAVLIVDEAASATWNDITPLARNEWICWVISAKKAETRDKRVRWGCESLGEGRRRPCCWPGCPHR